MIFVDTGVWFALFANEDPNHDRAVRWFESVRPRLWTTDYVVDETLTLLRARSVGGQEFVVGEAFFAGQLATIVHVSEADFREAWKTFSRFSDKKWSFTDCVSKVVMARLNITVAASFDHHFRQFATIKIVP